MNTRSNEMFQAGVSKDSGKMFVGGLSWGTTEENLRDYFRGYGEIIEINMIKDHVTNQPKGYGFIHFLNPASVGRVLAQRRHELNGKSIETKLPIRRTPLTVAQPAQPSNKMIRSRKVFVGALPASTTLGDLRRYFQQFGPVEDVNLVFDKITRRHKGYGFVTLVNEDIADIVCELRYHEIKERKRSECKRVYSKESSSMATYSPSQNFNTRGNVQNGNFEYSAQPQPPYQTFAARGTGRGYHPGRPRFPGFGMPLPYPPRPPQPAFYNYSCYSVAQPQPPMAPAWNHFVPGRYYNNNYGYTYFSQSVPRQVRNKSDQGQMPF